MKKRKNNLKNLFIFFMVAFFMTGQAGVLTVSAQEIPSPEPEEAVGQLQTGTIEAEDGETAETPTPIGVIRETSEAEITETPVVPGEGSESSDETGLAVPADFRADLTEETNVKLTWSQGDEKTTEYLIERSTGGSGEWLLIAAVEGESYEFADTMVVCESTYLYRMQAYSRELGLHSEYSEEVIITTNACATETPELAGIETFDFTGFEDLASIASENGTVKVIVQLDTSFQAEGSLSSVSAVQSQRNMINMAQQRVLNQLSAENVIRSRQFETIPYMSLEVDQEGLAGLINSADVISIMENRPIPADLNLSVPRIGGDIARKAGYDGSGWAVAIIDTGVDKTHPFLSGKVVSEACYSTNASDAPYYYYSTCPGRVEASTAVGSGVNCSTSVDGCDHGTHVAGIVAGSNTSIYGVAPGADIISIKVYSHFTAAYCSKYGYSTSDCALAWDDDILSGLERVLWLRNNTSLKIASVNMSLGNDKYTSYCNSEMSAYKSIIDNLKSKGVATVIASGNDGYTNGISAPACVSSAISVGATTDSDTVASYSNSASFLDLLAPGSYITSSVPGTTYESWAGTSMAAPHVAGAWAVMRQRYPTATVDEILGYLTDTGVMITDSRNNIAKPRIQLDEALKTTFEVGTHDADEAGILFTGTWQTYVNASAYDGSFKLSKVVGSTAELNFDGVQISLLYTATLNRGMAKIYIDDVLQTTLNQSSATTVFQKLWTSEVLSAGEHTFKVVHDSGSLIDFDAVIVRSEPLASALSAGSYDADEPGIAYTGTWQTYVNASAYDGSFTLSKVIGSTAELTFDGVQISLLYTATLNRGMVKIYIDDVLQTTLNQSSATTVFQKLWTSEVLSAGEHTFKVVHDSGSLIDFDAVIVRSEPLASTLSAGTYDADEPGIAYTGTWQTYVNASAYDGSFTLSKVIGSTAELTFNGVQISLLYTATLNRGMVKIYIDDVLQTTLNQSSAATVFQKPWHSEVLSAGEHTFRIVHDSGSPIDFDAVIVRSEPLASTLSAGTYDADEPGIAYTGTWQTYVDARAYDGTLTLSNVFGSTAELTFYGVQISLLYSAMPLRGKAYIYIDGVWQTTLDQSSETTEFQKPWISKVLTEGEHTFKVVKYIGYPIDFDAVIIYSEPQKIVLSAGTYDEDEAGIAFTGDWVILGNNKYHNSLCAYSQAIGNSAELTFDGVQISLLYTDTTNRGTARIYIDDVLHATLNQTSAISLFQKPWHSEVLSEGEHTFRVVHDSGSPIEFDAVIVSSEPLASALTDGTYDIYEREITFTGTWKTYAHTSAYDGYFTLSKVIGSTAELTFNGVQISLLYTATSNRGIAKIYIDDILQTTLDQSSAATVFQKPWTSEVLSEGDHTFRIVHDSGSPIDFDAVTVHSEPLTSALSAGTYDADEPGIAYTGTWQTYAHSSAYDGSFTLSKEVGSTAELTFDGVQISLLYTATSNRGMAKIFIDDVLQTTLDQSSATTVFQKPWTSEVLSEGQHTFRIVHDSGYPIDFDAIIIHSEPLTIAFTPGTYDTEDPRITFTGTWQREYNPAAYEGSSFLSSVTGSTAELTFSGVQISFLYSAMTGRGMAKIYIDNILQTTLDQSWSTIVYQKPWHSEELSEGDHTFRITYDSGYPIDFDAVIVHSELLPVTFTPGTYDADEPGITFTGTWQTYDNTAAYDGSYLLSETTGNAADLTFNGVQIGLMYTAASDRGMAKIYIDDVLQTTLDQSSETTVFQKRWHSEIFSEGEHTLRIVHDSDPPIDFDAIIVYSDESLGKTYLTGTHDANDRGVVFTGAWETYTHASAYDGSFTLSEGTGSSAELRFFGNQISLLYTAVQDRGAAKIYIDDVLQTTLDQSSEITVFQKQWTSDILNNDYHFFRIEHESGDTIDFDAFIIQGS